VALDAWSEVTLWEVVDFVQLVGDYIAFREGSYCCGVCGRCDMQQNI
jgi:hypothetical protein